MSLGAILTTLAAFVLVVAYIARPFRREHIDADRVVDRWVQQLRSTTAVDEISEPAAVDVDITAQREADPATYAQADTASADVTPALTRSVSTGPTPAEMLDQNEPVNFCPYCGRRVEQDHVFCPKCGRQLTEGA